MQGSASLAMNRGEGWSSGLWFRVLNRAWRNLSGSGFRHRLGFRAAIYEFCA